MVNGKGTVIRSLDGSAVLVFAGSVLVHPRTANADTIRCGTSLIREGATVLSIREKCGEPASIETSAEPIYERRADGTTYQVGTTPVDYWYYDFGSRRNPVRMTVKGGIAE